jgi:hypothetical protein
MRSGCGAEDALSNQKGEGGRLAVIEVGGFVGDATRASLQRMGMESGVGFFG